MAWRMFAGNVVGIVLAVAVGCSASDNSNNNPANADGTLCLGKADCPSTPLDASNGVDNDSNGATDDASNVDTAVVVVPTLKECEQKYGWITGKTGTCHLTDVIGSSVAYCVFSVVLRSYGCAIRCDGNSVDTSPADQVMYEPLPPASTSLVTPDTGAGSRTCSLEEKP